MLEESDLVAIRGIFREELHSDATKDFFVGFMGEMLEEIVLPRFDALEVDVAELKTDMTMVKGKLADMVTVDYMDRRLFDQRGELANSGIKASQQVKTLATELHRNGVITVDQFVLATAP